MILVIPSMEITDRKCAHAAEGMGGVCYTNDPIETAKLWRKENAKSLHVTDLDAARTGSGVNLEVIFKMVRSVDIPVELGGGMRSFESVARAIDNGIYRVAIGTMFIENPDEAKKCIDKFNPSKVVLAIDAENFRTKIKGGLDSGLTPLSAALNAKALGFKRVIYTDLVAKSGRRKLNIDSVRQIADNTRMRITVSGGISGIDDLLLVQELEPAGVDSVIIGRALYENKFPCQKIWRMCEDGNYPYTARI